MFLVSVVTSVPNSTPLKYRCSIKISNQIRPVYFSGFHFDILHLENLSHHKIYFPPSNLQNKIFQDEILGPNQKHENISARTSKHEAFVIDLSTKWSCLPLACLLLKLLPYCLPLLLCHLPCFWHLLQKSQYLKLQEITVLQKHLLMTTSKGFKHAKLISECLSHR